MIFGFLCTTLLVTAQGNLSLEIIEEHAGMVGDVDLSGFTTYRLYYELVNDGDIPIIIFGRSNNPLNISSTDGFFQDQLGSSLSSSIEPAIFDIFPSHEFDSWVTIAGEDSNQSQALGAVASLENQWGTIFEEGNDLIIDDNIGGAWTGTWQFTFGVMPILDGKVLLAQLTTSGNLWGTLNLDYVEYGQGPAVVTELGMTFGSPDEMIIGCTNENALNYDPEAVVDGFCEFLEGDLDQNGTLDIGDILEFLDNYGCLEDCGVSDLNGDGVVNIWDLLILLGLI